MNKKIQNKKILQIFSLVAENLQKKNLIKCQEKIVVTVSGGQDSTCLLVIFYLLRTQLLINFDLLFCHHFWQRSSFFTMLHVAKCNFCYSTNVMFFLSLKPSVSEKTARNWRHKVIQRAILFYEYKAVTQAHTRSDRIETILYNLIRGTGLTGVATLQFQSFQSLFSYNKFYPVKSFSNNFFDPLYTSIKNNNSLTPVTLVGNLRRQNKQQDLLGLTTGNLRLNSGLKNPTSQPMYDLLRREENVQRINCVTLLSRLQIPFAKQKVLTTDFSKNLALLLLESRRGSTFGRDLKSRENCLNTFTSYLLYRLLYTDLKRDELDFFKTICNKNLFQKVKKNKKVSSFRLFSFQIVVKNHFSFNSKLNVETTSKRFNRVKYNSETKTYKTFYKQLKRLTQLRVIT